MMNDENDLRHTGNNVEDDNVTRWTDETIMIIIRHTGNNDEDDNVTRRTDETIMMFLHDSSHAQPYRLTLYPINQTIKSNLNSDNPSPLLPDEGQTLFRKDLVDEY